MKRCWSISGKGISMKKWLWLLLPLCLLGACTQESESKDATANEDVELIQFDEISSGDTIAIMKTSMGDITIRLFPEFAPKAVENFITHAQEGYYDHLIFHRVIANFMIQGGDPLGNGSGGSSIWQEPFADEFSDQLYHFSGALSMANAGKDTNGSQFFIVQNEDGASYDDNYFEHIYVQAQKRNWTSAGFVHPDKVKEAYREVGGAPHLDYQHTVFGQVVEGMDVMKKISEVKTGAKDKPVDDIFILAIAIEKVK